MVIHISKRSATISWRGAYKKMFGFTYPPDGRKRHFPTVLSCMYPALKYGSHVCNFLINELTTGFHQIWPNWIKISPRCQRLIGY